MAEHQEGVDSILAKIPSSIDRLREAEWYIQQMEQHYHHADQFRWCLSSFLRALKEIPQILRMELQGEPGFKEWFRSRYEAVRAVPLVAFFGKQRDTVVHKEMLVPASSGCIGTTEGRGIKIGIGVPIDPLEDSEQAMRLYLLHAATHGDVLGVLFEDEESLPCVERSWRLAKYPDKEVLDLAEEAWRRMAELVSDVVAWLGGEAVQFSLERRPLHKVSIMAFDRKSLCTALGEIQARLAAGSHET
jgi:hypothetical protein